MSIVASLWLLEKFIGMKAPFGNIDEACCHVTSILIQIYCYYYFESVNDGQTIWITQFHSYNRLDLSPNKQECFRPEISLAT